MTTKLLYFTLVAVLLNLLSGCSNDPLKANSDKSSEWDDYRDKRERGVVAIYYSYINGQKFAFEIIKQDLSQSPLWNARNSANPVLSSDAAVTSSDKELKNLVSNPNEWYLHSITMTQVRTQPDRNAPWIYLIKYKEINPEADGRIEIPVLMNGKAIGGKAMAK